MSDDEAAHELAHAQAALAHANALIDARRFADALEPAEVACQLRPDWADAWWCQAVALKHARRWADCLAACERTIALDPENSGGMHWNAGIAATALRRWSRARVAWRAYGVDVPAGDGPLEMKLGAGAVRVSPADQPEVVFGERLDPCLLRIRSVPLPDSQRRYGDVVLHDGEPRGKRRIGGGEITVFDELTLMQRSRYGTWRIDADCPTVADRDALLALFDGVDGAIEDWTENLVLLCAQCSLGEPHDHHEPAGAWQPDRMLGLALCDEHELGRLRRLRLWWRRGVREVTRVL